jgi:2-polyprenyl-3-methyl-5-hydroxy-6-metoxy-1,4-benzoquinol methylase
LQELSLFYDRRYDCAPEPLSHYSPKFDFDSPHSFVLKSIAPNSRVLDLGCAGGYVGAALRLQKSCYVTGVDAFPLGTENLDRFYGRNLNDGLAGIPVEEHDYVLLLDVIEHLSSPERFLDELREKLSLNPRAELIISTANVSFAIVRLMLLIGQFNYGKRGILDVTHTRLFTFSSLLRTLAQAGFDIKQVQPIPAPFPLALGGNIVSRALLSINSLLNRIAPGLFAYQMLMRVQARPTVASLLESARVGAFEKSESLKMTAHVR